MVPVVAQGQATRRCGTLSTRKGPTNGSGLACRVQRFEFRASGLGFRV